MGDDNWDLHAVVRGCYTAAAATSSSSTTSSFRGDFGGASVASSQYSSCLPSFQDSLFEARNGIGDLHELYKPFFPKSYPLNTNSSSSNNNNNNYSPHHQGFSSFSSSVTISKEFHHQQQPQLMKQQPHAAAHLSTTSATPHTPRSKRRKNQQKKVCQVPAEALSSDVWAWRKYGQKPIKGSPYPRGYYRCSSSKGCSARKQVERNRSDPGMFIVTYTSEHNHPAPTHKNSLAGSTRQKSTTSTSPHPHGVSPTSDAANKSSSSPSPPPPKPTCSSPATSMEEEFLPQSTNTESREEKEDMMEDDEEGEFNGFSEAVSDDFFVGLEGLAASPPTGEDYFTDQFPANFGFPWMVNSTAATAAGGIS